MKLQKSLLHIPLHIKKQVSLFFLFICVPIFFIPAQDSPGQVDPVEAEAGEGDAVVLVSVTGSVEVAAGGGKKDGGKSGDGPGLEWGPVSSGTVLEWGNTVRAGENGSAVLLFSDGRKLTLHSNTMITVSEDEEQGGGLKRILAKLFSSIKNKFADSEYTSAALGEVGVIRGEEDNASLKDFPLSAAETNEMDEKKAAVVLTGDGGPTDYILLGILFEEYGQYYSAESAYKQGLRMTGFAAESAETRQLIKELLIDLYVKNELYRQAREMRESLGPS
jgi:hypothetical protein